MQREDVKECRTCGLLKTLESFRKGRNDCKLCEREKAEERKRKKGNTPSIPKAPKEDVLGDAIQKTFRNVLDKTSFTRAKDKIDSCADSVDMSMNQIEILFNDSSILEQRLLIAHLYNPLKTLQDRIGLMTDTMLENIKNSGEEENG